MFKLFHADLSQGCGPYRYDFETFSPGCRSKCESRALPTWWWFTCRELSRRKLFCVPKIIYSQQTITWFHSQTKGVVSIGVRLTFLKTRHNDLCARLSCPATLINEPLNEIDGFHFAKILKRGETNSLLKVLAVFFYQSTYSILDLILCKHSSS